MVLHGEDKTLASLAPGWDKVVELGCADPVLRFGFGSEPLSHPGAVGVSLNLHRASVSLL